jgi:hypothetical protein
MGGMLTITDQGKERDKKGGGNGGMSTRHVTMNTVLKINSAPCSQALTILVSSILTKRKCGH